MPSVLNDINQNVEDNPAALDVAPINLWLRGIAGSGGSRGDFQATITAYDHATNYSVIVQNPNTNGSTGGRGFLVNGSDDVLRLAVADVGVTVGTALGVSGPIVLSGHLTWSADGTWDVGAVVANRPRDIHLSRNLAAGANLTALGNSQLGNASTDAHSVYGTWSLANEAGTVLVQGVTTAGAQTLRIGAAATPGLYHDVANSRTLVNTATALSSASNDVFAVVGGTSYFAGNPAIGIRFGAAETVGWTVGVAATGANQALVFKDDGGTEVVRFNDTSFANYSAIFANGVHVLGPADFDGAVSLGDAAGDVIDIKGASKLWASMTTDTGIGINIDGSSVFGSGLTITTGGIAITAGGLSVTAGNILLDGTAQRIQADFSNATIGNRAFFQTSTTNGSTVVGVIPNGSGTAGFLAVYNNSTPTTGTVGFLRANATAVTLSSTPSSGSTLPLRLDVNGTTRAEADTTGVTVTGLLTSTGVGQSGSGISTTGGGALVHQLGASGPNIYVGSGAPTISAAQGSLYLRTDGSGTTDRAYIGRGGTTWTALTTVA